MVRAVFTLLLLLTPSLHAEISMVAFLSQKTNEIRNFELCRQASIQEMKTLAGKRLCAQRSSPKSPDRTYDEIAEQTFFDSSARLQIEAEDCQALQAQGFLSKNPGDDVAEARRLIARDFSTKIVKLSNLAKQLEPIEDELAQMSLIDATSNQGETLQTDVVDEKRRTKLLSLQKKIKAASSAIAASLWQSGNHFVQEFVLKQVQNKNFDANKFEADFLKGSADGSFDALLTQISNESLREKSALLTKASGKPLSTASFNLNDKDKIRLYRDQNWLGSADLQGLSCRLEGRYGVGRDRFYTAAEVTASVALTVLPGGILFATGRGLITLTVARTLAYASLAVATSSLAVTFEKKCFHSALHTESKMSCESPSKNIVQQLDDGNCALDVALAGLDIPFPEMHQMGVIALGLRGLKSSRRIGRTVKVVQTEIKISTNPQLDIWKAHEVGDLVNARKVQEKIRETLANGKADIVGKVDEGKTGAFYLDFEDGIQGVWKPAGTRAGIAELAVAKIDKFLKWNLVPETVPRELNGIKGTVQLRVTNLQQTTMAAHPDELAYFDYLIGNGDRRPGNYLVTDDRRLVAIDGAMAFRTHALHPSVATLASKVELTRDIGRSLNDKKELLRRALAAGAAADSPPVANLRRSIANEEKLLASAQAKALELAKLMTPPKAIVDRLRSTSRAQWRSIVGPEITEAQLDEMIFRQKEILKNIDMSEAVLGTEIYQTGPARMGFSQLAR